MNKLYTYVIRCDTGLAPNPFWGCCTLAVCTPNHQGSRVERGDWIVGFLDKQHGYKFLYAMEVRERIHRSDYFKDAKFSDKKPQVHGSYMQQCGDNFYSLDAQGCWRQHETVFHKGIAPNGLTYLEWDTRKPWVFVAKRFWYLGREAQPIPDHFAPLAGGRGARHNHNPCVVDQFKLWVERNFKEGITALPRDMDAPDDPASSGARGNACDGPKSPRGCSR